MQEGNDVCKIGLMITYKEYVSPRKTFQMLRTADAKPVEKGDTWVGEDSNDQVDQFFQQNFFYPS